MEVTNVKIDRSALKEIGILMYMKEFETQQEACKRLPRFTHRIYSKVRSRLFTRKISRWAKENKITTAEMGDILGAAAGRHFVKLITSAFGTNEGP